MKVFNQTRNMIIAEEVIEPKTLLDKSLGLLRYKTPVAMLFHTRYGIHTFGMRYAIDVLILDKDNQVVAMKQELKPNLIFTWDTRYESVLELPRGTIKKTTTALGDTIKF